MSRPPAHPPLTWTPFVLLGLLTVASVGGPAAIAWTIRGGASPSWPPDRPVEWWTFGLCTGAVLGLMASCLLIGLLRYRRAVAPPRPVGGPHEGGPGAC